MPDPRPPRAEGAASSDAAPSAAAQLVADPARLRQRMLLAFALEGPLLEAPTFLALKIAVVAYGSRGDVQPLLTLAARLVADGHQVTLCVPADFAEAAQRLGCRGVVLPAELRRNLDDRTILGHLRRGETLAVFKNAVPHELARAPAVRAVVREATSDCELLVASAILEDLCVSLAEARGQRLVFALPSVVWPNPSYPHLLFGGLWLPGLLNEPSHRLVDLLARELLPLINDGRRELGLRALRERPGVLFRQQAHALYWVPAAVLPPPANFPAAQHVFTGYWVPTPEVRAALGEREPPRELVRFVEAGAPPLFVCFGSMPVLDDVGAERIVGVAARLGLRVVLSAGWSRLQRQHGDRVLLVGDVDHDWLLPRCVAALHHGGASTTGAVLRAGIPQVVASVFADQPFWGERVRVLGVGETMRFHRMSAARLEAALSRALTPPTEARARMFAAELAAAPDGAQLAARIIARQGSSFPVPPRR